MKERPILFNAEMVRAILDGRKTQTRRIVKPQPSHPLSEMDKTDPVKGWQLAGHSGIWSDDDATSQRWKCPFGIPGTRLWVRETWQSGEYALNEPRGAVYRATDWETTEGWQWKPSIHMPRWASRITLEITDVRVERLRDMSLKDSFAEGCCLSTDKDNLNDFQNLWEFINGPGSWEKNPWVWVITFRRMGAALCHE